MIVVDYSGVALSSLFAMGQKVELSEGMLRHLILNSLRSYNFKHRAEYGRLVVAVDNGSWRRGVFPQYKACRKKSRDDSGLDWKELYRMLDGILQEIRENLPYWVVSAPNCEADDVIASLAMNTQEFGRGEPVLIVSADQDFIQLQRYPNVRQWSNTKKKFLSEKDPQRFLLEHVLGGDAGDGVPNVLSPDNTFVDGLRQKPLTKKTLMRLMELDGKSSTEIVAGLIDIVGSDGPKNLERNRVMIDLSKIPIEVRESVIHTYDSLPRPRNNAFQYLCSKRCTNLLASVEEFDNQSP